MKIDNSISSTYGLTSLFGQSGQRNKQQPLGMGSTSLRQSGTALEPSTTPPSISNTMWALQSGGSTTAIRGVDDDPAAARHQALLDEFSHYANMTPGERIRAQILDKMGLSEDALKGMPTDQREAIEKQMADEIKRQLAGIDDKGTSQTDDIPAA